MSEDKPPACWTCPVCARSLARQGAAYRCTEGHSFDLAREGYLNLLLAHQRKSAAPGDDPAMLQARRAFLDAGHYAPFSRVIGDLLVDALPERARVLEVGCGEGYYLRRLAKDWAQRRPQARLAICGLDIAKPAVRLAAKAMPEARWAVASSFRIPVAEQSLHAVLRLFAPGDAAEFLRVLQPGGLLLIATPGPRHLLGLKSLIYDEPRLHAEETPVPQGFELMVRVKVQEKLRLSDKVDIANLFRMTPFWWRADRVAQDRLLGLERLDTDIEFHLALCRKR